jgi:predicted nucleotidyltransferase
VKQITLDKPPIDYIVKRIVDHFNPRRIIMFGSYAKGNPGPDSDIDLLIEMDTDLARPWREIEVDRLFRDRLWAMDVFVYTPEEVEDRREVVGTIIHTAEHEGKVLYQRGSDSRPPDSPAGSFHQT